MSINTNDFYIRNKKRFIKLRTVSCILLAVFLILTVVFWFLLNSVRPVYMPVTVTVERTYEVKNFKHVFVNYNDEEYELINVTDLEYIKYSHACKNGDTVEVLFGADGELYSNVDGVRTNTPTGKLYFTFLGFTLALIFSSAVLIGCVVEAKKREKGIYPKNYRRDQQPVNETLPE